MRTIFVVFTGSGLCLILFSYIEHDEAKAGFVSEAGIACLIVAIMQVMLMAVCYINGIE